MPNHPGLRQELQQQNQVQLNQAQVSADREADDPFSPEALRRYEQGLQRQDLAPVPRQIPIGVPNQGVGAVPAAPPIDDDPFSPESLQAYEQSITGQRIAEQELRGQEHPLQPPRGPGLIANISEAITGANRTTPEIEALDEIGLNVPEMRQLSAASLQSLAGLLITSDQGQLENILQSALPDATFKQDSKGNRSIVLPSGEYALNKPGFSSGDFARTIAEALAFIPLTAIPARAASISARVAGAAAMNTGIDTALQVGTQALGGENDFDKGRALFAGIFGAGGQAGADLASGVFRAGRGVSPDNRQLLDASEREGVPVFTSDINQGGFLQTVTQTTDQLPLAGRRAQRLDQRQSRVDAVNRFNDSLPDIEESDIVDSLRANARVAKNEAGDTIDAMQGPMDELGPIDLSPIIRQIDDSLEVLQRGVSSPDTNAINAINTLRERLVNPPGGGQFFFSDLRKQATFQREQMKKLNKDPNTQLLSFGNTKVTEINNKIKEVLEDAVGKFDRQVGEDIAAQTGNPFQSPGLLKQYKDANVIFGKEAEKLSNNKLKTAMSKGKSNPEAVDELMFSMKTADVRAMMGSLDQAGRANVRASVIKGMVKRSFVDGELSPNKFTNQINKRVDTLNIIFGKDSGASNLKRLKGMAVLFKATEKAERVKTAPDIVNATVGVAATTPEKSLNNLGVIISLASKVSALTNVLESKVMRNLLLKLADNPRDANKIISRSNIPINALLQAPLRDTDDLNQQ